MEKPLSLRGLLQSRAARILTVFLIVQASLFYGFSRAENPPANRPLSQLPNSFDQWQMVSESVIEDEVKEVLKADELLTRFYAHPSQPTGAHLFVAYFRSQRTGQAPHSPKNCLPGSGWVPSVSDVLPIKIDGRAEPIKVNRYLVAKGDNKSIVLYWYQSRDRVVASEYTAKFFVVADALRYNRTDTALVRVVVPVVRNDAETATDTAVEFVQAFFNPLREHFPA
ncbi:MAG: exosortase C-terminal domain/associated protein EpsI [Bryobacteraceae bacterium]